MTAERAVLPHWTCGLGTVSKAEESSTGDGLATHVERIRRVPLLDAEEERRLGCAAARGDSLAKRRLIEANLRLVVAIARRRQVAAYP
jgi:DNA-directed RNA polymerase sigma subunit (sigma70/sigma32)